MSGQSESVSWNAGFKLEFDGTDTDTDTDTDIFADVSDRRDFSHEDPRDDIRYRDARVCIVHDKLSLSCARL